MAARVAGSASTPLVGGARRFRFGVHRYLPVGTGGAVGRSLGPARFVEATRTERAYWEAEWTDVAPAALNWHEPLVRVEVCVDERDPAGWQQATYEGRAVDDQGWRLGITYRGPRRGRHRYVVRWYGPPLGLPVRHRFVLVANGDRPETAGEAFD
jgi:hypothetical protein